MSDLFEQRGFALQQDFKAEQIMVQVDRDELIQALTNLMRNSLQALEDQGSRGSHSNLQTVLHTSNEGNQIIVDIEDNGIGIPKENQSRLFESSFTTKSPDQGTGLGLGISRRFVRNSGGDIEFVSSEPGTKTIFRIRIPIFEQHDKQGAVA